MASSDDEGDAFPDSISEFYFQDKDNDPLSFSKLPVQWNESEISTANVDPIFLNGKVDNGLGKFYQQVKAWKYDISRTSPEISVLLKDNHWIKLEKPRKSYENLIRSILISVHCLSFLKSKPEALGKSLWDHLAKVFSLYDVRPSENDLIDQIDFLKEAVMRDETLSKSKFLATFLENPRKKNSLDEDAGAATKPSFIVDDINGEMQDDDIIADQSEDNESDDEDDHFDSVCAICDNGGDLTCCEGKCFRSFHASKNCEEAQDSNCESLCLTPEELEILPSIQFKCENCKYDIHQCFVCAKLGSSDKSKKAEVFRCSSATCGHFYHPHCVSKLLQKNDNEQQTLKEKIAAGEPFICPAHKCVVCNQTENEKVKDLQFAVCRRCPKSYHRKCLPREIMFEDQISSDDEDGDDDDEVRAWEGLLTKNRALIYCIDHEIDPELATPARTIKFRNILNRKIIQPHKKKPSDSTDTSKNKLISKSQKIDDKSSAIKPDSSSKKRPPVSSGPESLKRKKVADGSKNLSRKSLLSKVKNSSPNDGQPSLGSRLFDFYNGVESNNLEKGETDIDEDNQIVADKSQLTEILPPLDDESKKRIMAIMRETASSITLDEVRKYHQDKVPSTHAHSSKVDKNIILARVEGSVEAVNVAFKKLDEGCSVEEAMSFCEPAVIDQLMRWKDKLKVYLAPFLHGMRYTSYGRHFTKVEKLEQIVDKLHWYVEDGDTIVDFCCGANDFSILMKKRLDETGKKNCSYRNFDIARPKNDFNFEKRDWTKVSLKELPSGSRLIMGLNPPFGKNAALANQFIECALKFKPKLMILIVPPETKRLDSSKRRVPYDLIWEDAELLSGKSFYFPGSIDVNDKQIDQKNVIAPPLYLWSRPDLTHKHKSIAQQHGHIPQAQQPQSDENGPKSCFTVDNKTTQLQQPLPSNENGTKSGGKRVIEDGGDSAIKKVSETACKTKSPKKKRKKQSSGSKIEQNNKKGKGNQNSNKKPRLNEEIKIEKDDDRVSNRQDLPQKSEEVKGRVEDQKHEIKQAPVEVKKNEKTRVPVEDKKNEITRVPVEVKKREKTPDPVEAQKHEKTRDHVEAQKHELNRVPSCKVEVQKREATPVPSREIESHKNTEKTGRAPSREIEAPKQEKAHVSPREFEAPKQEKARVLPRELEAQKHEKSRISPRETDSQKHEKPRVSPREIDSQKYEKPRVSPREIESQKNEKARVSPRKVETHKHEKARASSREFDTPKHEKVSFPSREYEAYKYENKRASPHMRDNKVHEHLNTDFSFVDVDQPLGGRNSAIDESTFSLQNDLGQSYDGYLGRKYTSPSDEPYNTSHRRLDGSNHGYSVRSDHHQYPSNDGVVSRSPFLNETGSRVSNVGYTTARYEPGLNRHTVSDTTPYNRTSTSATQRYAPKLDELNHTRANNLGRAELDEMNRARMGGFGRAEPPPPMGSRGVVGYRQPVNGPGFGMGGFAPGSYYPHQHNSSGGWLNE